MLQRGISGKRAKLKQHSGSCAVELSVHFVQKSCSALLSATCPSPPMDLKGVPVELLQALPGRARKIHGSGDPFALFVGQASAWGRRQSFCLWWVSLVLSFYTSKKSVAVFFLFPHPKKVEDIQKSAPFPSYLHTEQRPFSLPLSSCAVLQHPTHPSGISWSFSMESVAALLWEAQTGHRSPDVVMLNGADARGKVPRIRMKWHRNTFRLLNLLGLSKAVALALPWVWEGIPGLEAGAHKILFFPGGDSKVCMTQNKVFLKAVPALHGNII